MFTYPCAKAALDAALATPLGAKKDYTVDMPKAYNPRHGGYSEPGFYPR